jgi:hypothetical protein
VALKVVVGVVVEGESCEGEGGSGSLTWLEKQCGHVFLRGLKYSLKSSALESDVLPDGDQTGSLDLTNWS